jgi:hypothetical protein
MARALSTPGAECAACRHGSRPVGWPGQLWAALPRPVQHYGQAAIGQARIVYADQARFWPRSRLELENSFSIFHSVSNWIQTLKFCI